MKDFKQKRVFRGILQSWPVLISLGLLVLFFAWGMFGFLGKMMGTRENRQMVENKVIELEKEKEKLDADIANLQTEEGIEESIRKKFGLAKEGEGLIVILEDENKVETKDTSGGGFFSFLFFWKNWFK